MDCLNVKYENKPCYNIYFRPDFSDLASVFKSDLNKEYDNICVVSDSNVAGLYLAEVVSIFKSICNNVCSFSFDAGEASKNLDTVSLLYEHLIIKKFTRSSLLVALGGGVVGDLTGFAAATFLRGIDFIQMPTTLLSQVDSSVGGKTGVDFNQYKNMVGAFKMPKLVYMNIGTLKTLDDDNFACGMGEVIKHGLISDKDFYQWLKDNIDKVKAREYDALSYMVMKNCDIKRHVVEIDPTEKGIRAYLNFGHTLGHAIEKLSNFSLGHGQCVGIGMVCASFLSKKLGNITEEQYLDIINCLKLYNMPINVSGLSASDILEASKSDKKMTGKKIKFTILKAIGEASSYLDFTDEDLLEAIDQVLN
ncbi:3-dehydroquinate synthase [Pseudobutyrivibrio sp. 49]|uniref:3-dehydroquinate synthase n=1 Tax=unclassified Pseudobutyrivibrio TaxID=2638619 RepID=UPI00088C84EC|nr:MULTISPECIES: 3-dehydroquinate synthase [unclassified Pseudobutyrivibrio]SDH43752.1 3-dehydroquinate synthase [Pseudobutyrivibrio sp. 49]SFN44315.1 3-dehydroquinate synthase [Pseudobutyrivibrio sp. UC1225]